MGICGSDRRIVVGGWESADQIGIVIDGWESGICQST